MQGRIARRPLVLVVEADTRERELLGSSLERGGFDVLLCPGPSGPDFTCVGSREGACPLVASADVVVLDLWLESDTVFAGTPGEELLGFYLATGRPVVALATEHRPLDPYAEEPMRVLPRHAGPGDILEAVRQLIVPRAAGGERAHPSQGAGVSGS